MLLAQLDVITPLRVVMLGCVLNVVGDLLWVPAVGAVGAAWVLLAQVVSLPLMLWLARRAVGCRPSAWPGWRAAGFSTAARSSCSRPACRAALIQSLSTQFTVAGAAAQRSGPYKSSLYDRR